MSEQDKPDVVPSDAPAAEPVETAAAASPDVDVEALVAARVAELEGQLRDVQLRAQAEIQNIQRRAERDVTQAHKFALEKFAGGLLEVVDNLERALQVPLAEGDAAQQAVQAGVQLTLKQLLDLLKRHAVEAVDPVGEPFNPDLHQAVSMQPSDSAEPNTVTAVLQKGYTLSGRLLRPAMVVVAAG